MNLSNKEQLENLAFIVKCLVWGIPIALLMTAVCIFCLCK